MAVFCESYTTRPSSLCTVTAINVIKTKFYLSITFLPLYKTQCNKHLPLNTKAKTNINVACKFNMYNSTSHTFRMIGEIQCIILLSICLTCRRFTLFGGKDQRSKGLDGQDWIILNLRQHLNICLTITVILSNLLSKN